MKFFFKVFNAPDVMILRWGAGGFRQWLPVIILLTLLTAGGGGMAECSPLGGMVGGPCHLPTGSCCRDHGSSASGPKTGCLHAPVSTANPFSIDHWHLPLSAETDLPDFDPVAIKTKKSLAVFIPEAGPILRPVSERQQTFTPLYLAHQSLLC